jgi:hypothetical protein
MAEMGQARRFDAPPATSGLPRSTDIARLARLVRFVPAGNNAHARFVHRVAQFPSANTVCQLHQNCRITVFGLRHVAIAYPCVGLTRNYIRQQAFAHGFMLLWIGRSNLRLSERVCAVHYPVGVQSIDLGVR